jgi:hypothetical protein
VSSEVCCSRSQLAPASGFSFCNADCGYAETDDVRDVGSPSVTLIRLACMAMTDADLAAKQRELCLRYGTDVTPSPSNLKCGVARNVEGSGVPLHGLRHPPEGDTTGWFFWVREFSSDSDFFIPLHVAHLGDWRPEVLPYLGLPPGWRILLAPGHEDVWFDANLLEI